MAETLQAPAFCAATGYTMERLIRTITKGHWIEGQEFRRVDGRLEMDVAAFERWVQGMAPRSDANHLAPQRPKRNGPSMEARTALYRHFDADDRLLYVGISLQPFDRFNQHKHASSWLPSVTRVTIEWHSTRREALQAETVAIQTEAPVFNIQGARRGGA